LIEHHFAPGHAARSETRSEKGEAMVVVPLSRMENEAKNYRRIVESEGTNWARIAAGGSLLASGLLLLTGNRRAGLATAAAGTALALLDQQEVVKALWDALPGYVDQAQHVLGQVEETVVELATQRERLHTILTK
jgi:hypothetical protein